MPASKDKQAEVAHRRQQVVAMRAKGIPPSVIAAELGVTEQRVYEDVSHELKTRREEINRDKDLIVVLEVEELDEIRRGAWEIARGEHLRTGASGQVSLHPVSGEPLRDATPNLQAYNLLLRTQDRRTRLLGLDAAQKLEVHSEVVTLDAFDAAIRGLREQLDALPGTAPHASGEA